MRNTDHTLQGSSAALAPVFALFLDSPTVKREPILNRHGQLRVFGSEREAQEAIARIGLRKLQAFLDGKKDFDDALTVEEYYLEVRLSRNGLVVAEGA